MKLRILFLTFISISLFAMETALRKRLPEESVEQLQGDPKTQKGETEEIAYPKASLMALPAELQCIIFEYLITATGETATERLVSAATNVRNLLMSNKQFKESLDDEQLAGKLITELARRYSRNNIVNAAIALDTNAASKWLARLIKDKFIINQEDYLIPKQMEKDQFNQIKNLKSNFLSAIQGSIAIGEISNLRFLLTHYPELANVKILIEEFPDAPLLSPLDYAVMLNSTKYQTKVVSLLLKLGAKFTDNTVLMATRQFSPDVLNELTKFGADLHKTYGIETGGTLLFAVTSPQMVRYLHSTGLDINQKNGIGRTPLHNAVIYGMRDVVAELLSQGADPNIQDDYGYTPLHYVNSVNHDLIPQLIAAGANIELMNFKKNTPLAEALLDYRGNFLLIEALFKEGALLPARMFVDDDGLYSTPLIYTINTYLEKEFEDEAQEQDERKREVLALLELLVKNGANVNEIVQNDDQPELVSLLSYYKGRPITPGTDMIIEFLTEHGAKE